MSKETSNEVQKIEAAFEFFNTKLFAGSLESVIFTFTRKRSARGYFWPETWQHRQGEGKTYHEIALNPATFQGRSDLDILSTLVHEQVHQFEEQNGTAAKGKYHNKSWANKMKEVGLHPSDTGAPGGKETGNRVSHYVIEGGPFEQAVNELLATGWSLAWQATPTSEHQAARAKAKRQSKTKYTCPECGANAWAKPDSHLICGLDMGVMTSDE